MNQTQKDINKAVVELNVTRVTNDPTTNEGNIIERLLKCSEDPRIKTKKWWEILKAI